MKLLTTAQSNYMVLVNTTLQLSPPLAVIMHIVFGIVYSAVFYDTPFFKWYDILPGFVFIIWEVILIFRKKRIKFFPYKKSTG